MTTFEHKAGAWFRELQVMRDGAVALLGPELPPADESSLLQFRGALGQAQSALIEVCQRAAYPPKATAAVQVTGPESAGSPTQPGGELPEWSVFLASDDGEAVGHVQHCSTRIGAQLLGSSLARHRKIRLVDESRAT